MLWIVSILLFNLSIVFLVELTASVLLGARGTRKMLTLMLINIITNPLVVICSIALTLFAPGFQKFGLLLLELGAFFAEGFMFSKFGTFEHKNPYFVSFVLNILSYTAGELIGFLM